MSRAMGLRSGRRRAMAERYADRGPTDETAGRLNGLCGLCGGYHRQPDLRRRCEGCGDRVCVGVAVIECPRCGGRLVDEGEEMRSDFRPGRVVLSGAQMKRPRTCANTFPRGLDHNGGVACE